MLATVRTAPTPVIFLHGRPCHRHHRHRCRRTIQVDDDAQDQKRTTGRGGQASPTAENSTVYEWEKSASHDAAIGNARAGIGACVAVAGRAAGTGDERTARI